MSKIRRLIIVVALVVLASAGLIFSASKSSNENKSEFTASGYVLVTDANSESKKIYFEEKSEYGISSKEEVVFSDIQDNTTYVPNDSFFHFDGNQISALVDGVFMDLDEVGNDFINHYQIQAGMVMTNGNKVSVETDTQTLTFDQIIWKLNDDRYIILGNNLKAYFSESDVRSCGDYVELNYLDRGVVQIITEDNVWQTALTSCYIETEEKIQIFAIDERLYNPATDRESFMNSLVVDADDNMHLRSIQEKNVNNIIPHFNVVTEDGESGDTGESGEDGETGTDGNKGQTGAWGTDAGTTSSSKTEIPTMSITEWEVNATTVKGAIYVTDTYNTIVNGSFVSGSTVFVREVGGTEQYSVVSCDQNWVDDTGFNFQDETTSYFKLDDELSLKPDTEYELVIRGQYEMGSYNIGGTSAEVKNYIYRDFVYRTFYTDSLGVMISKETASSSTITIKVDKQDYSLANNVTVFLLTEQQNEDFDITAAANEIDSSKSTLEKAGYLYKQIVFNETTYETASVGFGDILDSGQTALPSNTNYVARLYVEYQQDNDSIFNLSDYQLAISTLKQTPTITGIPTVASNRQNKSFEIYTATISDPDNAITSYIYEIYNNAASSTSSSLVKTLEISPSNFENVDYREIFIDGETISFGETYYVVEKVIYNDNEKVVTLDQNTSGNSVASSTFTMVGTQLPSVSFRYLADDDGTIVGQQYDRIAGWIVITKNGSDIKVNDNYPISVSMEAEGIFSKQMLFTNSDIVDNGNEILIYLDENALYRETIYRLTVSASVYTNESEGLSEEDYTYVQRILGNIVVETTAIPVLKAVWATNSDDRDGVSTILKLVAADEDEDISYLQNTLSKLTVQLYSGSVDSGSVVGEGYNLIDTDEYEYSSDIEGDLFEDGLYLGSETTFAINTSLLSATSYSFKISYAADYTYDSKKYNSGNIGNETDDERYVNEITITNSDSGTIGLKPKLPDLPVYGEEDQCVTADEITKETLSNTYGLTNLESSTAYSTDNPDNRPSSTVVGFKLQAQYDNSAKLARNVIYYAFEAKKFDETYKAGTGADPLNTATYLSKITLPIDTTTNKIPSLIMIFGTDPNTDSSTKHAVGEYFQVNGQYFVYTGLTESTTTALTSGMGRGFIYMFAYQMQYASNGQDNWDSTYPYNHSEYADWNKAYNYKPALVLRSTYKLAPKTYPTFESYPWETYILNGSYYMSFKYRFIDPDSLVKTNITKFVVNADEDAATASVTASACNVLDDTCAWTDATVPVSGGVLENENWVTTVSVTANAYNLSYVMSDYGYTSTEVATTVLKTPWVNAANRLTYNGSDVTLQIYNDSNTLASNYLQVRINLNSKDKVNALENFVGVILHFTEKGGAEFDTFCEFDNGQYLEAKVPLSKFASYLGKTFTVTADLVYDTDDFGWKYAGTDTSTALQKIVDMGFDYYITKSPNSTSIIESDNSINSYFTLKHQTYKIGDDETTHLLYVGTSGNGTTRFTYVYSNHGLVYEDNVSSGVVPKLLGSVSIPSKSITFTDSDLNGVKVDTIVPTGSKPSISSDTSSAKVTGLELYGSERITEEDNKRYVYLEIYAQDGDGKYTIPYSSEPLKYQVNLQGDSEGTGTVSQIKLDGLTNDTDYLIKYFVKTGAGYVQVLDSTSSTGSVLTSSFSTKDKVTISNPRISYVNTDYLNKQLKIDFSVDQTTGIKIQYSINVLTKDSSSGVESYENYLSYQDLLNGGYLSVDADKTYASSITEYLTIMHTPNNGVDRLVPGVSYQLQIIITDLDGKQISYDGSGHGLVAFTIPASLSPAANISIIPMMTTETVDSVQVKHFGFDFSVTAISDDNLIVMGTGNGNYGIRIYKQTGNGDPETLVTDTSGIVLTDITTNKVITLSSLYATVFDSTLPTDKYNITGLDSNTSYRFVVYSAIDANYDHINDNIDAGGTYDTYKNLSYGEMISSYSSVFDSDSSVRDLYFLIDSTKSTPDESGISIGYISSKINAFNSNQIQLVYFDSSGLDGNIDKLVISAIHESGSPSLSEKDGVINGSSEVEALTSYDSASGIYTLSIPTSLISATKSGVYTVIVKHYSNNRVVYTYSGKLVKE